MEDNPYESPAMDVGPPVSDVAPGGGWKLVLAATLTTAVCWIVPFANFPAVAFLGWAAARAWPSTARRIARTLSCIAGAMLIAVVWVGVQRLHQDASWHGWLGHLMFSNLYLSVAFSLGCLWKLKFRLRPIATIGQSIAILLCLAMTLSATITGYLKTDLPTEYPFADELHNRFVVVHIYGAPIFIATMLAIWNFAFRPLPLAEKAVR